MSEVSLDELLPQRPPFLFVDEVLSLDEESIITQRKFRSDEDFFKGHFPGNPIVPGVLILESMAQSLAILARNQNKDALVFLTGLDRARFRKPVFPEQTIRVEVKFTGSRLGVFQARAKAWVGEERVADARLSGAIQLPENSDELTDDV
ncbi:3-hydroxyacyl-ACP dehydratase FabZ [Myxococcota bacterium]|nr:3-hydroxyacyl-ACP dehydratase FabZ [Myxococcota bacterium]